jgi:hypothetical protein
MRSYLKALLVLLGAFGAFTSYGYFFGGDDWKHGVVFSMGLFVVVGVLSELYKLNGAIAERDED